MEICNRENFEAQRGQSFRIRVAAQQELELRLKSVMPLTSAPNGGGRQSREAFSVIFGGPTEFVLPQRIYTLHNAGLGTVDIFIVPIGPEGEEMQYQAIFN